MTLALKLLCRVVQRRMDAGEPLDDILQEYPKLTEAERALVLAALTITA